MAYDGMNRFGLLWRPMDCQGREGSGSDASLCYPIELLNRSLMLFLLHIARLLPQGSRRQLALFGNSGEPASHCCRDRERQFTAGPNVRKSIDLDLNSYENGRLQWRWMQPQSVLPLHARFSSSLPVGSCARGSRPARFRKLNTTLSVAFRKWSRRRAGSAEPHFLKRRTDGTTPRTRSSTNWIPRGENWNAGTRTSMKKRAAYWSSARTSNSEPGS